MAISLEVIVFFLLLFLSIRRYRANEYFRFLPYLIIFIFMAARYDYGDGKSYRIMFNTLHNGGSINDIEPLYTWINKLLPSFEIVIVITSFIYIAAFYLIISGTLSYQQRGLGLLIMAIHPYILMVDMSAIRQSVAIALIIIGVYIANKSKRIYYIPFCILATLFHKSAILLLPVIFLFSKKNFSALIKGIIFGGAVFFLLVPDRLFELMEVVLPVVGLDSSNYLAYLNNGNENGSLAIALSLIIMAFFIVFGDTVENRNAIYVKLSVLAMLFEALQGRIQQFGRIDMYFLPFLALSLPLILKRESQRVIRVKMFGKSFLLSRNVCWLAEICFIVVFAWKFIGFMTPQFAYQSVFTIN